MKRLLKNSKFKHLFNHIGMLVIYPFFNSQTQLWEYKKGIITDVWIDDLKNKNYSIKYDDVINEWNITYADVNKCYLVDKEQRTYSNEYDIQQGDKITYEIDKKIIEGTVLMLFRDGDLKTEMNESVLNANILTVNGEIYIKK